MNGRRAALAAKAPKERGIIHLCVTSDNSYIVKHPKQAGAPPEKIFVPWLTESDPRFFVRNGELIKPYGVVEFALQRIEPCPELNHDRAFYKEVSRTEFDPTGCVPITYFDIEKLAESLNAAQTLMEERIPDSRTNADDMPQSSA